MSSNISKLSALLLKKKIKGLKKRYESSEHGGAPILGISKPVIKAHGAANEQSIVNTSGILLNLAMNKELFDKKAFDIE